MSDLLTNLNKVSQSDALFIQQFIVGQAFYGTYSCTKS